MFGFILIFFNDNTEGGVYGLAALRLAVIVVEQRDNWQRVRDSH